MDMETLLILACCLLLCIGIPMLIARSQKKKNAEAVALAKAAREAREAREAKAALSERTKKALEETREKAVRDTLKKYEPAKKEPEKKEPEKKEPVSRLKTDPAFSGAGDLSSDKPKILPHKVTKAPKPREDMELETFLQAGRGSKDRWKCYYCGTENKQSANRCVVCAQTKPPTGV